jgi:hypothetical protein
MPLGESEQGGTDRRENRNASVIDVLLAGIDQARSPLLTRRFIPEDEP